MDINEFEPSQIYLILNKFDQLWQKNRDVTFCELYNKVTANNVVTTDEELLELLRIHLEKS
jgi:hypothetical protein